ncbi:MAG TPA: LptF/LptG family permease [Phycisphaerae bacterium]|nr:LptF/LptG family permease [Phycisphaerae bacterium]
MFKFLHWYILRDLLRIFLLTSTALTTILAFGGTFRPLTKENLTFLQLMTVLVDLIPAMLAYSIPLSALFAAVMVYWRLATDNELTGARASGISYASLCLPALILGLAVGGVDLLLVGYVVPVFVQKSTQAVESDLPSLLLYNINEHQPFQFFNTDKQQIVIYADKALQIPPDQPPDNPNLIRTEIQLQGMAATILSSERKPSTIVLARAANVIIDQDPRNGTEYVSVEVVNGTAFDSKNFRQIQGNYLPPPDQPYEIPSPIKNRPRFLDFSSMYKLKADPKLFAPIGDLYTQLDQILLVQQIAHWYFDHFEPDKPIEFSQTGQTIQVLGPTAALTPDQKQFVIYSVHGKLVQASVTAGSAPPVVYTAGRADLEVDAPEAGSDPDELSASLILTRNVRERNMAIDSAFHDGPPVVYLGPLEIPAAAVQNVQSMADLTPSPDVTTLLGNINDQTKYMLREIISEVQSRCSFAFSCIVLVLFGTALGILLQDRNPLAVFVLGVAPAMILVLLINTGRDMVTHTEIALAPGLILSWLGNSLLLMLNAAVYSKLLRR